MVATTTNTSAPSTQENNDLVGMPVSHGVWMLVMGMGWPCCLIGVLGNLSLVLTVYMVRQRVLRNTLLHVLLIGNLALADLAMAACCMPFWLLDIGLHRHPVLARTHCVFNAFLFMLLWQACVLSQVLIAFHRYLSVCQMVLYRRLFGRTGTWLCCLVSWLLSAAVASLPLLRVGGSRYDYSPRLHLCILSASDQRGSSYPLLLVEMTFMFVAISLVGVFSLAKLHHRRRSKYLVSRWRYCIVRYQSAVGQVSLESDAPRQPATHSLRPRSASESRIFSRPSLPRTQLPKPHRAETFCSDSQLTSRPERDFRSVSLPVFSQSMSWGALWSEDEMSLVRSLLPVFLVMMLSCVPMTLVMTITQRNMPHADLVCLFTFLFFFNKNLTWIVFGVYNKQLMTEYSQLLRRVCP